MKIILWFNMYKASVIGNLNTYGKLIDITFALVQTYVFQLRAWSVSQINESIP